MESKRRAKSSGAVPDSASGDASDLDFGHKKTNLAAGFVNPNNVGNQKLQVVGIGRPDANVLKTTELSIGRVYKVQWKKEKPNPEELARLYWVQGLSQVEIARLYKIRRDTISTAVKKFQPVD